MLVTCGALSVTNSSLLSYLIPQQFLRLDTVRFQRAALCRHVEEAKELCGCVWQCTLPFFEVRQQTATILHGNSNVVIIFLLRLALHVCTVRRMVSPPCNCILISSVTQPYYCMLWVQHVHDMLLTAAGGAAEAC